MHHRQQGMTLIGMLFTLATVVVLGIIAMRVIPIYIENYEVKHSIRSLATLPPGNFSMNTQSNVHVLKTKLMNQLYISGVETISRKDVTITPKSATQYEVSIDYTAKRPLVGNISILVDFKEREEINIRGS